MLVNTYVRLGAIWSAIKPILRALYMSRKDTDCGVVGDRLARPGTSEFSCPLNLGSQALHWHEGLILTIDFSEFVRHSHVQPLHNAV